jgi:hypothetical protein
MSTSPSPPLSPTPPVPEPAPGVTRLFGEFLVSLGDMTSAHVLGVWRRLRALLGGRGIVRRVGNAIFLGRAGRHRRRRGVAAAMDRAETVPGLMVLNAGERKAGGSSATATSTTPARSDDRRTRRKSRRVSGGVASSGNRRTSVRPAQAEATVAERKEAPQVNQLFEELKRLKAELGKLNASEGAGGSTQTLASYPALPPPPPPPPSSSFSQDPSSSSSAAAALPPPPPPPPQPQAAAAAPRPFLDEIKAGAHKQKLRDRRESGFVLPMVAAPPADVGDELTQALRRKFMNTKRDSGEGVKGGHTALGDKVMLEGSGQVSLKHDPRNITRRANNPALLQEENDENDDEWR